MSMKHHLKHNVNKGGLVLPTDFKRPASGGGAPVDIHAGALGVEHGMDRADILPTSGTMVPGMPDFGAGKK